MGFIRASVIWESKGFCDAEGQAEKPRARGDRRQETARTDVAPQLSTDRLRSPGWPWTQAVDFLQGPAP